MTYEYFLKIMKPLRKRKKLESQIFSEFNHLSEKCDVIIVKLAELNVKVASYPSQFLEALDGINAAAIDLNNLCKRRRNEL